MIRFPPYSRYIDATEPIRAKLLFPSPIRFRKGAYPPKTRHVERRCFKSGPILDYFRCKLHKIKRQGIFKFLTGLILKHLIRLISSHVYKVEQKMTALLSAIKFTLENEAKLKYSVNFASLHHSRKCFIPLPLLKASVLLLK